MRVTILLALLLTTLPAGAEEFVIGEDTFDSLDLASLKSGDWVETGMSMVKARRTTRPADIENRHRLACVQADADTVRIEDSQWFTGSEDSRTMRICDVNRKTRKVTRAWIVQDGKPVPMTLVKEGSIASDRKISGKVDVKLTSVDVGDKAVVCDKLAVTWKEEKDGEESRCDVYFSEETPFKIRLDDPRIAAAYNIPPGAKGVPREPRGLVRFVNYPDDAHEEIVQLLGFGTDAKPTVEVK